MFIRKLFFCLLFISSTAYAAPTDDIQSNDPAFLFSQGSAYEKDGKTKIAFDFYEKAADLGHSNAQLVTALMYGKDKLFAEREKYLLMAAEQGNPVAQNGLGLIAYREADQASAGFNQNILAEARKWFTLAAEQGHYPSQVHLIMAYSESNIKNLDIIDSCAWSYYVKDNKDYYEDNIRKINNSGGRPYIDQAQDNGLFIFAMMQTDEVVKYCNQHIGTADIVKVSKARKIIEEKIGSRRFLSLNDGSLFDF